MGRYSELVVEGGFEYLVNSWEQTVMKIETGYTGMLLEYENDLNSRRNIHDLWLLTSAEQQIRYGLGWKRQTSGLPMRQSSLMRASRLG